MNELSFVVFCVGFLAGFWIGGEIGRALLRREAVMNGVAEWTASARGWVVFKWKELN